jgi:O-antigen ligase
VTGSNAGALPGLWPALPVTCLLVALVLPWVPSLGSFSISAYRLVLLAMVGPCIVAWLSGKAGKVRPAEILLLGYCAWCGLSIVIVHGFGSAIEPAGMLFVETMGAYLVGRHYVRSARDFTAVVRLLFCLVLILLPFAIFETLTGYKILLNISSAVLPTIPEVYNEPRWGLSRVQSTFDHPILYGVFCGSLLALAHMVLGRNAPFVWRWAMSGCIVLAAFLSFSSGPLTALVAQVLLLLWSSVFHAIKSRWRILGTLVLIVYLLLELTSDRSVPAIFISMFAFDSQSALYRLAIWEYGGEAVRQAPWFGVGFGDWPRPGWMSPSIDMFWMVPAIRHGLPAVILMALAFLAAVGAMARPRRPLDEDSETCRTALLIVLAAFFIVGWSVHFWNATYVLFMFLLGSGMWLAEPAAASTIPASSHPTRLRATRQRRPVVRRVR